GGKGAEISKLLNDPVDVDGRKSNGIRQFDLGERNDRAVEADRFAAMQLLAQQMSDAFKGTATAHVQQAFADAARFQHCDTPPRNRDLGVAFDRLVQILVWNAPDGAVGQRSHSQVSFGRYVGVKGAKIAGVVKGVYLALAAFQHLVETGHSS